MKLRDTTTHDSESERLARESTGTAGGPRALDEGDGILPVALSPDWPAGFAAHRSPVGTGLLLWQRRGDVVRRHPRIAGCANRDAPRSSWAACGRASLTLPCSLYGKLRTATVGARRGRASDWPTRPRQTLLSPDPTSTVGPDTGRCWRRDMPWWPGGPLPRCRSAACAT